MVLNDSRRTPRARALEELGYYDPTRNPKVLSLKEDRIAHWVSEGAIVSETVAKLRKKGVSGEAAPAKNVTAAPAPVEEAVAEPAAEAAAPEASSEEAAEETAAAEEE